MHLGHRRVAPHDDLILRVAVGRDELVDVLRPAQITNLQGNERQRAAMSGNERQEMSGKERQGAARSGKERQLEAIRGNQGAERQLEAIRGN